MGSMISLGVGKMEIDWGKNNMFRDHSALFTDGDIKDIPYYYAGLEENEIITEYHEGFSRNLSLIKRRLDLLGYSLKKVEKLYNDALYECSEYGYNLDLSFDSFSKMLRELDISKIDTPGFSVNYEENGYDFGEFVQRCILPEEEIYNRLLQSCSADKREVRYALEIFFENFDPYIILRLLAENPSCKNLDVYWSYADVVEGGWVSKEDISKPLPRTEKIMIVTEGSSDTFILQKTIESLHPDISDFFQFIDMHDNYPFTGTGSLYNFCCGLMKININNKVIVIFDNDVAGLEKYNKLKAMTQLDNMLITKLPDHEDFISVETIGPLGTEQGNINGTAVAIECFLDFSKKSPQVRWANYVEQSGKYQGSLVNKDSYVREFKKANLTDGSYDTSKLIFLVDYLLEQWIEY